MKHASFVRFCIIGLINTAIDVPLLAFLHNNVGLGLVLANICSTSVALTVSFILNRRFTFPARHVTPKRIALYFAVTLGGLWGLQPIIIKGLLYLNQFIHFSYPFELVFGSSENVGLTVAKLGSIAVTLVWNYLWYSRVVFLTPKADTGSSKP